MSKRSWRGPSEQSSPLSQGLFFQSPTIRGNLTRQYSGRDPLAYYEVLQVLGAGSMGTVAKVRKKQSVIGGSAKYNMKKRHQVHQRIQNCFQLPLVGGLFSHCLKGKMEELLDNAGESERETGMLSKATDLTDSTAELSSMGDEPSTSDKLEIVRAMKSIHLELLKDAKDQILVEELRNEVEILKTLDHIHIVRVIETFDYRQRLFVVMEMCSGGDLFTRDPYTEDEAARICSAILSAVAYMHAHKIIHRDLKYENILFTDKSRHADVKLIDFGLSERFKEHDVLQEGVGTIYTMAPEVLQGNYTKQADLWSIGVIAYMLLSSLMPFYGEKRVVVVKQIASGKYKFKGRRWKKVSDEAKAFVQTLLVLDPNDRSTAEEALKSPWLQERIERRESPNPHAGELQAVKKSIERYVGYPKLRKITLLVVAHKSESTDIGILRKVFQHYDKEKRGFLRYEEFKAALHDAGYTDEDYREIFNMVDVDGSGVIRWTEFLAATMEAAGWISPERLAEAFDRVDHDDTGYISKANLRFLLGADFPEHELDDIMSEAGSESGEGISYKDFMGGVWNDDKEEFERELNKHIGEPTHTIGEVTVPHKRDSIEEQVSFLTVDDSDPEESAARSTFLEGKTMSERKNLELAADVGPKTPSQRETMHKSIFRGSESLVAVQEE